jgi:hypothetical protein
MNDEQIKEVMRLAACGVVAMSDAQGSAAKARDMREEYRSASCDDVARRVDECISLRAERDALAAELKALREQDPVLVQHRKPIADMQGAIVGLSEWKDGSGLKWWPRRHLYAHPVPARELTDEEILNALDGKVGTQFLTTPVTCKEFWLTAGSVDVREFVRAIEAAMRGEDNV